MQALRPYSMYHHSPLAYNSTLLQTALEYTSCKVLNIADALKSPDLLQVSSFFPYLPSPPQSAPHVKPSESQLRQAFQVCSTCHPSSLAFYVNLFVTPSNNRINNHSPSSTSSYLQCYNSCILNAHIRNTSQHKFLINTLKQPDRSQPLKGIGAPIWHEI